MTAVAAQSRSTTPKLGPSFLLSALIVSGVYLALGSPLFPLVFPAGLGFLLALGLHDFSQRHGEVAIIGLLCLIFGQNLLLGLAFNTTDTAQNTYALMLIEAKTIFSVALFVTACSPLLVAAVALPDRLVRGRLPAIGPWWFFAVGGLLMAWCLAYALVPGPPPLSRFGYLRNFTSPLVYGAIGYRFFRASRWDLGRFFGTVLTALAIFGFAATAAQVLWPTGWAEVMSIDEVSLVKGPISQYASVVGGNLVVRRGGLLGEGVNAAYCFGAIAVFLWQLGRRYAAALAAVVAGLALGKGGLGASLVALALVTLGQRWLPRRPGRWKILAGSAVALVGALALVTPTLTSYGEAGLFGAQSSSEIHIRGAMTGLTAAARSPMGHGLGAGGNFSDIASGLTLDRREWIATGSESAMGVIGYQLGAVGLVLVSGTFAALVAALFAVAHRSRGTTLGKMALAAAALIASIGGMLFFQENSLSPQATGLVFLVSGAVLGAAERSAADDEAEA